METTALRSIYGTTTGIHSSHGLVATRKARDKLRVWDVGIWV